MSRNWFSRGAEGRWELQFEVVDLLNRANAGTLDRQPDYDPTSDRPQIVETSDHGLPRFPTLGGPCLAGLACR